MPNRLTHLSQAAVVALLLAAPGAASAGIDRGYFNGVVTDGIDQNNLFGFGFNADLTGKSVTGDFYYNPSAGFVVGTDLGTSGFALPPVVFAEVFVGGAPTPVFTNADDNGDVSVPNNHTFTLQADDFDGGFSDSVILEIGSGGPSFDGSGVNWNFKLTNPALEFGSFYESIGDPFAGGTSTQGDFTITAASLVAAPEPASATLLAAGTIGTLLKRRRRT